MVWLRRPWWPVWQWPRAWQWGLVGLGVTSALGGGGVWWWNEHQGWLETEAHLVRSESRLATLRQKIRPSASGQALALAPTSDSLAALSATWVAQAESGGVKVVQLRITPAPTAVTSLTAPSATAALLANAGADPRKATFTVQARGSYGALKQWLGQTMQLQPWAVVDKLEWRLSDAGSGEIDAQIIWGVYVQD